MPYCFLRYNAKPVGRNSHRARGAVCYYRIEFDIYGVDASLISKMHGRDWEDPESWEDTGVDVDENTVFENVFPLSGEPSFAVVRFYSEDMEDAYPDFRMVINDCAEILTENGDLLERVI